MIKPANLKADLKRHTAAAAIAVSLIGGFEGFRSYVYLDPVGIPTYCFGETHDPNWGHKYSKTECQGLLLSEVGTISDGVDRIIHVPMSESRRAAVISFTYNVGLGTLKKSSLARRLNAGDPKACDALLLYVYAAHIKLPGLVKRREQERAYCYK